MSEYNFTKKGNGTRSWLNNSSEREAWLGGSTAVQVDKQIFVSGMVGRNPNGSFPIELEQQVMNVFHMLRSVLAQFDASLKDVVRINITMSDPNAWRQISLLVRTFIQAAHPAFSISQMVPGIDKEAQIEIEVTAVKS